MVLSHSDLLLIFLFFLFSLSFGLISSARLRSSLHGYFLSGRNLPWWLAGSSMVATTFAADTPLWVSGTVAEHGISGNWLWWSLAAGTLLTVFFFARLWRRAGVMTDLELIELRYGGKKGRFLRGFRAIYIGFALNCIVMAWVHLALLKLVQVFFPGYNPQILVLLCALLTLLYVASSGMRGIVIADSFQFLIAMGGCVLLAVIAFQKVDIFSLPKDSFRFLPDFSSTHASNGGGVDSSSSPLSLKSFAAYVLLLWWASWYPGAEPGGGGYIAQRILSARDEKQGMLAALWFAVAHYAIRSWPWIVASLAAVVLYPHLQGSERESGFIYLIRDILPSPWKGLLIAAFLGAYMSTFSTHLHWGSSYLINDFYKRFLSQDKSEGHYIFIARLSSIFLAISSLWIAFFHLDSIQEAWSFLLDCTAGMGFVLILRWYWWRINALAEIVSMIAPLFIILLLRVILPSIIHGYQAPPSPESLFIIVPFSICLTLLAMYLSPPEDTPLLQSFFDKIRPAGPGWKRFAGEKNQSLIFMFTGWLSSLLVVYGLIFFLGSLILSRTNETFFWGGMVTLGSLVLFFSIKKDFQSNR